MRRESESGGALFEMLLFLPLLMLFITGILEAGFLVVERAAIRNASRAGLSSHLAVSADSGLLTGSLEVDRDQGAALVTSVCRELVQALERIYEPAHVATEQIPFNVRCSLVGIRTQRSTASSVAVLADTGYLTNFSLSQFVPAYPLITRDDYLSRALQAWRTNSDELAPALAEVPRLTSPRLRSTARLPWNLFVHVEVTALSRGIAPRTLQKFLGEYYGFQDHAVEPVRAFSP